MNIINLNVKKFQESKFDKKLNTTQILDKNYKKGFNDAIMHFDLNQKADPFSYNGIKVIYCDNPNLLIRDLLNGNEKFSKILINNESIKNSNILHISPFTKISDVLTLKTSGKVQKYLEKNNLEKMNQSIEELIIKNYNELKDDNIEQLSNINLKNASILSFIELKDEYVSSSNIKYIFNILKEASVEKMTIIINDYHFVNVKDILESYIKDFNFLILTTNFKKWINQLELLETLLIMKDVVYEKMNQGSIEIVDTKLLIDYLEETNKGKFKKSDLKSWLLEQNL